MLFGETALIYDKEASYTEPSFSIISAKDNSVKKGMYCLNVTLKIV